LSSIFISYSSKDVGSGRRLRDLLEARGYATVFRDRDEERGIPAGTKWATELFSNLDRSEIVVFLASTASLKSPWCHTELAVAVARGKHVVQVAQTKVPTHPLLTDRQTIPPEADLERLIDKLVAALSRVGFPPGDPFTWDPNRSPYPGLRRLDTDHAAVFFGRDPERALCLERLAGPRPAPLLVSGPSGSGKSSLIRAGVLPRLALQEGTLVLPVVEPGNSPLERVALAFANADKEHARPAIDDPGSFGSAVDRLLAGGATRVVLFLDQAEDLVTRAPKAEVSDLVRRLEAIDPERLVLIAAVRSASLDGWLQEPALAWLSRADPVWVRPLDRNALREVILRPAQVAGIRFDPPELVDRILDDTGEGNALPLLAALLGELTKSHSRLSPVVVTSKQYDTIGPVGKVIEQWAAAATADIRARRGVDEAGVIDAYLRLVEIDEDGQVTAAEVRVDELPTDVREIFADLEQHRLVVRDQRIVAARAAEIDGGNGTGSRSVEVISAVHEEVFRSWPALAASIKSRRTDLEIRTWLRRDARQWRESGGGQVSLAGGRLGLAREWSERHPAEVTTDIRAYLRTARNQLMLRRVLTFAVPALAIVAIVVGALAVQAIREAQRANAAQTETDALRIAGEARAAFASRLDLGLLLAIEAAARSQDLQTRSTPLVGLTQGPGPRRFEIVGQPIEGGAIDDAGHRAILLIPNGVLLWDVDAGHAVATLPRTGGIVAMSSDGSTVAVGGSAGVDVGSWPSGQTRRSCPIAAGSITGLRLSATGDSMVVVADNNADVDNSWVAVLNVSDCGTRVLNGVGGPVNAVAIDTAGDRVALNSTENGPGVWQLSTGLPFTDFRAGDDEVNAMAFGSGDRLAGVTPNGELLLWDLNDLTQDARRFRVHDTGGAVVAVAFSVSDANSDLSMVAGTGDGQLRLIRPNADPSVAPSVEALPGLDYEAGPVGPIAAALDGSRAVTIDPSGRVIVWDLEGSPPLGPHLAADRFIRSVAPLSDGSLLVADGQGAYLMSGADGSLTPQVASESVSALAAGPGRWAAGIGDSLFASTDAAAGLRSISTVPKQQIVAIEALPDDRWAAAFTDPFDGGTLIDASVTGGRQERDLTFQPTALATDGKRLFLGDMKGAVHIIENADLLRPERTVQAHAFEIASIAISPDGSTVATGSDDRTIALWNVAANGALTERIRLHGHNEKVTSLTFSPDGHWLASAGEEPAVILWNLDLNQQIGDRIRVGFNPEVAFAPNADRQLYVADGRLDQWDMRIEGWPKLACEIIGARRLVAAEQRSYLSGQAPVASCP